MKLLYRGKRDGVLYKDFHNKCDNKGKTICLFLNDKDNIFGGYSSIPWTSDGGSLTSNDCFLFTLTNIYNTEPTKFPYVNKRSVLQRVDLGPTFGAGCDIYLANNMIDNESNQTNFPYSYKDTLGKGKSLFTGDFNNEYKFLKLKEIEVFSIS